MSYFSNERKMYVPLSIDTVEAERSSYFLSNQKMVYAVVAFLPLIFLLYPLVDGGVDFLPIIVVVSIYMFIYTYFFRFVILEEKKLRNMIRELDNNRVSGVDHFWGIDKIGGGKTDDGMIYYAYKGNSKGTTKALIVKFDRGSTIGVPVGHYENFRKTKERFLRKLHQSGFDFQWYEMQKKPELQESLIDYADKLGKIDNEYHQKLLKLQLNIQAVFSMSEDQRYEDYIVVKRSNFSRDFRLLLESIIDETLRQNGYIVDPHILGKREVEKFFKDYLMIDSLDSDSIRKSVDVEPFENFAKVHRLVDSEGKEVPIQFIDNLDIDAYRGRSIERDLEAEERKKERREELRKKNFQIEMEKLNRKRNRDMLSHDEYLAEKEKLEHDFHPDNYNPNAEAERIQKEREKEQEEKRRIREERRKKQAEEKAIEIKEYDLNDYKDRTIITGEESLDAMLKNQFKQVKNNSQQEPVTEDVVQEKETNNDTEMSLDELMRKTGE